ncbi:MAG TPA: ABC transporter permease [Blastocatellia bacterium]|jgi:putative ABC transport system permease protein|nr:ABC transporter permease [Blastocatellia bacterium]
MENVIQDLRYAVRVLLKSRGFTAVAVMALALGIGANTAVFSVVNAVLLKPLPYKDSDRLVLMLGASLQSGQLRGSVSPPDFLDYRERNTTLERLAAVAGASFSLTGGAEPERIQSARVSEGFFEVLGVDPAYGRTFTPEEEQAGRDQVAVLGNGLWQRRFGADPNVIGQSVTLNDRSYLVVGVMPAGFQYPRDVELWVPFAFGTPQTSVRRFHYLRPVGRLKPGVSLQQAQADFTSIARSLAEQYPDSNRDYGAGIVSMTERTVGDMRQPLWILSGAVGFVLLIACANVANLLLARASARQKEIAIRSALGATRGRVTRQLLTESVLLSLLGGASGLLVAWWGVEGLAALSSDNIPRVKEVGIDGRVLGFTLLVSLVTGVVFGLIPAIQASRTDLNETLKEGGRTAATALGQWVRRALVVFEVAIALFVLIGAGLMIKSFMRLSEIDPGFKPDNVLTMQVALTQGKYPDPAQRANFFKQLIHRLEALPGVQAVGTISQLPMSGQNNDTRFSVEGRPADRSNPTYANSRVASPDYFKALGIPLLKGRYFSDSDSEAPPRVVIISESFAREFFPDEDPVGQRLAIDEGDELKVEIVGVVGNVRHQGLAAEPWREMYVNQYQAPIGETNLVVRAGSDPTRLTSAIKGELQAMDKDVPLFNVRTMEKLVSESVAQPRFRTLLLTIFAAVAMALAAVGIYGVMSYYVTQRTREIGIRMALGATSKDVMRLVVGQGMALAVAGVAVGLAGALLLTRLMASLLYQISASDPATFAVISITLTAVALLASYIPARRATKVDPMEALRYE